MPEVIVPKQLNQRLATPLLAARLFLALLIALPASRRPAEAGGPLSGIQAQPRTPAVLTAAQVVNNPELVHARLRAKNPGYRNQGQFALDPVLGLVGDLSGGGVTDLSPLQGIPFGALDLKGGQVSDLAPLKGMPLMLLALEDTHVIDLNPLEGMKIEKLYLNNTSVSDLKPLAGMPLRELMLVGTPVKDIRPLRRAPIEMLWLNDTPVADISPLAGCPMMSLTLEGTGVSDLRPLSGMSSLRRLHIGRTPVSDLTPLKNLKLTRLIFSPKSIRVGLESIRTMKTLIEVGTTLDARMPPAQFWQLYDQKRLH
jgi:internalin A